jgi:hypothetical protein
VSGGWQPWSDRPATRAAAKALITDAARSDASLAQSAGVSTSTIGLIRARLESIGVIPAIPVSQRQQRPRPRHSQSPTALAIAQLGPLATPQQVADLAHVSLQAAHKALKRTRPRLPELAAVTDALAVSVMPRQLPDAAAARDQISVQALCARCVQPFTLTRRRRTYCTPACADQAAAERGHQPGFRLADSAHHPPPIPSYPPPPDFSRGLCTTVPPRMRTWWTSSDRTEREAAARACQGCPVFTPCQTWSLALPVTDSAIYAGMSGAERLKRKREALRELARQAMHGG